jgi:hypothetical protein
MRRNQGSTNLYPSYLQPASRWGVIFRLRSFWVGCHYSDRHMRFCINLVPCLTFWFTLKGGSPPMEVL